MIQRLTAGDPTPAPGVLTAADLAVRFGPVSLARIGWDPLPGLATEADVLRWDARHDRLYELVDGVLLEKAYHFAESMLNIALASAIISFIEPRQLGFVTGVSGPYRVRPGRVRLPDAAFVSWDRAPGRRVPCEPIPSLSPDLAVEVVNPANTEEEVAERRRDYFASGTRLVWQIDLATRTAALYTGMDVCLHLNEGDALDGGDVLPGFTLPLTDLFAELDRQGWPKEPTRIALPHPSRTAIIDEARKDRKLAVS